MQAGPNQSGTFLKMYPAHLFRQWFRNLADARRIIDDWREHYNMIRPHSSLGYVPPAVFESQVA
jgi:putative transposase